MALSCFPAFICAVFPWGAEEGRWNIDLMVNLGRDVRVRPVCTVWKHTYIYRHLYCMDAHKEQDVLLRIYLTVKSQEALYWRHLLRFTRRSTRYINTEREKFLHWCCDLMTRLCICYIAEHTSVKDDLLSLLFLHYAVFSCVRYGDTFDLDELKDSCLKMRTGSDWCRNERRWNQARKGKNTRSWRTSEMQMSW